MALICDHCDERIESGVYRVTSEEGGEVLLDMIVCHRCYLEARRLNLRTAEIQIRDTAHQPASVQHSVSLMVNGLIRWLGRTLKTSRDFAR